MSTNISSVVCNIHLQVNEVTPSKKRKRYSDHICSTPKLGKPLIKREENKSSFDNQGLDLNTVSPKNYSNKENLGFNPDAMMEVKSISDLAGNCQYEVMRKPPKKKKRVIDVEGNCFVNEGLNLNMPEKEPVNPFEVKRSDLPQSKITDNHCFVNSGLNILGTDIRNNFNPFEVSRDEIKGIENPALELPTLSLGLPFTPTINRRINFKDISPRALQSPSTLLAKKLLFSPGNHKIEKLNELSVISEEAVNIDEELDCYQLELENSINEAKTKKKKNHNLIEIKQITNLTEKFKNLKENVITLEDEDIIQTEEPKTYSVSPEKEDLVQDPVENIKTVPSEEVDDGIQYEEIDDDSRIDDDEIDFKEPAPFTRAFRKNIPNNEKVNDAPDPPNNGHNFIKDIRRSIRKFIHPGKKEEKLPNDNNQHNGLLSSIRQSFRRKNHTMNMKNNENTPSHDISIIDKSEKRQIFREPLELEEGKSGTNHSSTDAKNFRKSKRNIMKNVFKKNNDYEFDK